MAAGSRWKRYLIMAEEHPVLDLLPGYALGCLDAEDEQTVKSHLASCSSCRRNLESYVEVTDLLSSAVPPIQPPARLESRVVSRLRVVKATATPHRSWRPALYAVAAMFVVALMAGNLLQWTGVIRPGLSRSPRFLVAALQGAGGAPEAYGTVVLDSADLEGVLAVTGLERLSADHQYQVWLIRGDERRSGGVFSVDTEGYGALLLKVPADFRDFTALGISVEPAGGSAAPTGAKVMTGRL
jgi:anti-sigma-K factor RskA